MKYFKLILLAIAMVTIAGCGGGGSGDPQVTGYTYQGAGSDWSFKSNPDGSCILSEKTSSLTINATCNKLTSGFTEVTVTSASGGNGTITAPNVGDKTYAYEIAGYMAPFIAPEGTKRIVVPAVIAGSCSTTLSHNFVVSFAQTTSAVNSDFGGWGAYGKYSTIDGKSLTMTLYNSGGTALRTNQSFAADMVTGCSEGKTSPAQSDNSTVRFYQTQNGGAILYQDRTNSSDSSTVGSIENDFMLPVETGITDLSNLDGNYIGFVVTGNGRTAYINEPIAASVTNGTISVSSLTSDTSAVATASHSSIALGTAKSAGLYSATLTHTNNGSIGCAVSLNGGGKKIIICGGLDPDDVANKSLYSVILATK